MSENNVPSAKPDPEVAPGEFDFTAPLTESPRMRRRSLKPQQTASFKPTDEASPLSKPAPERAAEAQVHTSEKIAKPAPASAPTRPASATTTSQTFSSTAPTQPKPTPSTQTTSPHGTRPATLYYSSGSRQDKETTAPMKSTPTASPSSSTPAPSTSASPARTAAPSTRPTSVVDYRTNVERQSREQKSVGGILNILVYTLIGLFVVGAALAGYGAYVVSVQLQKQSVTVHDLDIHYAQANLELNAKLATTLDTLTQAQAQIGRQQELIVREQETINKLLASTQETAAALRQERSTRADETSTLRAQIRSLENRGPTTQKY